MIKKIASIILLVSCFTLPAVAGMQSAALTLSPMYGNQIFEGTQALKTTDFWSIGLGYNLTKNWSIEGVYSRTDTAAKATGATIFDTKVETYHLDALYHFQPTSKLVPYVVAGIGAIYSSPAVGADRDHFLFNYGGGFKYFFLDELIALRVDIRHLVDFPEPDNNLQYSLGLTFQLGKPAN